MTGRGLLAEITKVISDLKILISAIHSKTTKEQIALIRITIEITSKEQFELVQKKLANLQSVFEVSRSS